MAVTKEQRRAAIVALSLAAAAGGGYVSKNELIRIGQQYCGAAPEVVFQEIDHAGQVVQITTDVTALKGTAVDGTPTLIKLELKPAVGLLAKWCDPDRVGIAERVEVVKP